MMQIADNVPSHSISSLAARTPADTADTSTARPASPTDRRSCLGGRLGGFRLAQEADTGPVKGPTVSRTGTEMEIAAGWGWAG